jgi:pimeloyl-ACP methyl ester carboxylesterase
MKGTKTGSEQRLGGCWSKGLLVVSILLIALMVLVIGGAIYEGLAQTAVAEQFPAPGRLVQVNGRAMHIHCEGEGSPTIVLDAGQGGWSSDWAEIMPELSRERRVCAYDRAGYGWSEAAEDERSPVDAADDLTALLAAAEIAPPYVLVSFSHAGLAGRIFAAQHAEQMAGLVLIDPATEFDNELLGPALMGQQQATAGLFNAFGLAAQGGLLRLLGTQNMAGSAPFIATDPADPDLYYAFVAAPGWWHTSAQEFAGHLNDEHLALVRELGQVPDIPLIIVGSEVLDTTGNPALQGLQVARQEMLQKLAAGAPQGKFIVAGGSTHNILGERPDVVRDAVEEVAGR